MNYWMIDETAKKWKIWRIPADAAKPERKSRRPFLTKYYLNAE